MAGGAARGGEGRVGERARAAAASVKRKKKRSGVAGRSRAAELRCGVAGRAVAGAYVVRREALRLLELRGGGLRHAERPQSTRALHAQRRVLWSQLGGHCQLSGRALRIRLRCSEEGKRELTPIAGNLGLASDGGTQVDEGFVDAVEPAQARATTHLCTAHLRRWLADRQLVQSAAEVVHGIAQLAGLLEREAAREIDAGDRLGRCLRVA